MAWVLYHTELKMKFIATVLPSNELEQSYSYPVMDGRLTECTVTVLYIQSYKSTSSIQNMPKQ